MRNIDGSIFKDDFIGMQSHRLRLLWIGLILAMADDQGRIEERPIMMKLEIFPFDTKVSVKDIEDDLKLMNKKNKIIRYVADGKRLIQIINWWKYQAGAQWASRSLYKSPPKWTDRIRCHEKGHGQNIVTENWGRSGGYNSKPLPNSLPSQKVADSKPQASREHEHEHEDKHNEEQASKGPVKTGNESHSASMPAASPVASKQNAVPDQDAIRWIRPVLFSLGIKGKRLEKTCADVAIRNLNGTLKHHVLGTIATVYADKRKANKPIIVAMRLENNEEPLPEFMKPETWTIIPKPILEAAGIHDLAEMFSRPELKPFIPAKEKTYTPMPDEVREKIKELVKSKSRK